MMGLVITLVVIASVFCAASLIARSGDAHARLRRRLRQVKRSTVREAEHGQLVRLVGTARTAGGPRIVAPLSGRECLLVEVWSETDAQPGGAFRQDLRTAERTTAGSEIQVEDATGYALVRLEGAELDLEPAPNPGGPGLELLLLPGAMVAVVGLAERVADPDGEGETGYRQAPTRLILRSSAAQPVLLSVHASTQR